MSNTFEGNPFADALFHVFNQLMNDPDIAPKLFALAATALVLRGVIFIAQLVQTARRKKFREQYERMYNSSQRQQGFERAGWQCEFDNGLMRCRNRAEHADHFYPWARGGATSMRNLVAACSGHNLAKGAKMPSPLLKSRIEGRRRRYFPKYADVTAGEWSARRQADPISTTVVAEPDWA